ncbi:MAG: hypothetical protein C0403_13560 [Desulfobacterium sp.]|nr:hypothetical protein [Desulfobacterium sp.]
MEGGLVGVIGLNESYRFMVVILLSWIINFLICFGLGLGIFNVILKFTEESIQYDVFRIFWFGFVILIGILQVYSLFFSISFYALLFVAFLSIAGYLFAIQMILEHIRNIHLPSEYPLSSGIKFAVAFTLGAAILYLASQSVTMLDTYIYHYNAVRWANEYPAVPGLVHINYKLAFNSSFFLIAALNDIGCMAGTSSHTIVSFLIAMTGFHWIYIIAGNNNCLSERTFAAVTVPFIVCKILLSGAVSSLSTDLPMYVLYLVFSLELLRKDRFRYIMLAGLSACLISFKLSGLPGIVVTVILLVMFGYKLFITDLIPSKKDGKIIFLVSCFLLLFLSSGFISRNAILSGWMFFPVPVKILNLHLPWSENPADVKAISDLIKGIVRAPGNTILGLELGFQNWFVMWLSLWKTIVEIPLLAISIVMLALNLIIPKLRKIWMKPDQNYFALLLLVCFSFFLWFLGGPDLRYGSIYFFVFFALVINPILRLIVQKENNKNVFFFLISSCLILIFTFYHKDNYQNLLNQSPSLFSIIRDNRADVKKNSIDYEDSTIDVYTPVFGSLYKSFCGNSPIPCTADPVLLKKNRVKLRVPSNLSKGFVREETFNHELDEIRNYYESKKYYNLGSKHEQEGEIELAVQKYEKSASLMPKAKNSLQKLAVLYTKTRDYNKAISTYIRLLHIYPQKNSCDYNIACLYALKNDKHNSIIWLKKAIKKGYSNWNLIQKDPDLENIRNTLSYQKLMKER